MAHFLGRNFGGGHAIGRAWASVTVRFQSPDRLVIQPGSLRIVKHDAMVVALPERFKVVDDAGVEVAPSPGRRFYVTTETFDPFHAVMEMA